MSTIPTLLTGGEGYGWGLKMPTKPFGQLSASGDFGIQLSDTATAGAVTTDVTSSGPTLLEGFGTGLAIGQAISSVYDAFASSKATAYALKQQAGVMKNNQAIAQMGAESAMRAGEAQVAALTYKAGLVKAAQRTRLAANGVNINSGSAAEIQRSTDIMKEIDKQTAQMNALASAWGYRRKASAYSMQSGVAQISAGAFSKTAAASAISSLLDKGTVAADRWYKYFGGA